MIEPSGCTAQRAYPPLTKSGRLCRLGAFGFFRLERWAAGKARIGERLMLDAGKRDNALLDLERVGRECFLQALLVPRDDCIHWKTILHLFRDA
jgi:hypothetical protein